MHTANGYTSPMSDFPALQNVFELSNVFYHFFFSFKLTTLMAEQIISGFLNKNTFNSTDIGRFLLLQKSVTTTVTLMCTCNVLTEHFYLNLHSCEENISDLNRAQYVLTDDKCFAHKYHRSKFGVIYTKTHKKVHRREQHRSQSTGYIMQQRLLCYK